MGDDLLDIFAAGHSASSPPVPEGCAQLFAPCLDIHCERPCGAHRPYTAAAKAITADMVAAKQKAGLLQYFAAFLVIGILITGAAYWGLSRVEHAYQIERT
jgi:hypothetical protein